MTTAGHSWRAALVLGSTKKALCTSQPVTALCAVRGAVAFQHKRAKEGKLAKSVSSHKIKPSVQQCSSSTCF